MAIPRPPSPVHAKARLSASRSMPLVAALASAAVLAAACAPAVLAAPFSPTQQEPGLSAPPAGDGTGGGAWTDVGRAHGFLPAKVLLMLRHDVSDGRLAALLADVSDPESPNRGRYVSHAEAHALAAPSQESVAAARRWLVEGGVVATAEEVELSPWGNFLVANTTVGAAEGLLGVEVRMHAREALRGAYALAAREGPVSQLTHPTVYGHVAIAGVGGYVSHAAVKAIEARYPDPNVVYARAEERERALAADMDDSTTEATVWPLAYFPPPVFNQVTAFQPTQSPTNVAGDTRVVVEFLLSCPDPDHAWPKAPVPLHPGDQLLRNTEVFAPCAATGGDNSQVTDFKLQFSPANGSPGASVTVDLPFTVVEPTSDDQTVSNGCAKTLYGIPTTVSGEAGAFNAASCLYVIDKVQLARGVQYDTFLEVTLASGKSFTSQFKAEPFGNPIRTMVIDGKLPADVKTHYKVPANAGCCDARTQTGVLVLQLPESGFYSYSDLSTFYQQASIPPAEVNAVKFISTIENSASLTQAISDYNAGDPDDKLSGPHTVTLDQSNPGGETTLDVQWASSMAVGALTTVWHGGYFEINNVAQVNPLFGIFFALQFVKDVPQVLSISYGGPEDPYSGDQFDPTFQAFGAAGTTIVVSSGDTGAFQVTNSTDLACPVSSPSWPATSPFVVAVGATQMGVVNGAAVEVPASLDQGCGITSGGGFSQYLARPSYQDSVVANYLSTAKLPPDSFYNRSGRGFPDVSLFGRSYDIYLQGSMVPVDGTSASAPTFAGMLSLMNDALYTMGGAPVGFINPTLYKMSQDKPTAFFDVTTGSNNCFGQDTVAACCENGFNAGAGWGA